MHFLTFIRFCWRQLALILWRQSTFISHVEPLLRLFWPHFRAGLHASQVVSIAEQHGMLWLRLKPAATFRGFVPGQHLDLYLETKGRLLHRSFSICSGLPQWQQQGEIELAVRIDPLGQFTPLLRQLKPGNHLHLSNARGEFVFQAQQPAVLIAAGSGITPLRSILSSISRLTQPMLLIYCYRGPEQLWFADEWLHWAEKFPLLTLVLHDSQQNGRLEWSEYLKKPMPAYQYYFCGPPQFAKAWQQYLQQIGVPSSQQQLETYGAVPRTARQQQISFVQFGQQYQVTASGSLLQLAEQQGLSPRYGCRRGVCQQCLCLKNKGQVRNLLTNQLSGSASEWIQLCISEAVTELEVQL